MPYRSTLPLTVHLGTETALGGAQTTRPSSKWCARRSAESGAAFDSTFTIRRSAHGNSLTSPPLRVELALDGTEMLTRAGVAVDPLAAVLDRRHPRHGLSFVSLLPAEV